MTGSESFEGYDPRRFPEVSESMRAAIAKIMGGLAANHDKQNQKNEPPKPEAKIKEDEPS